MGAGWIKLRQREAPPAVQTMSSFGLFFIAATV
jgi:hypothetical protein